MEKKQFDFSASRLTKAEMKKITGGWAYCDNAKWICGCIDVEGVFYHGPCGAAYCDSTYGGEPWCIRR